MQLWRGQVSVKMQIGLLWLYRPLYITVTILLFVLTMVVDEPLIIRIRGWEAFMMCSCKVESSSSWDTRHAKSGLHVVSRDVKTSSILAFHYILIYLVTDPVCNNFHSEIHFESAGSKWPSSPEMYRTTELASTLPQRNTTMWMEMCRYLYFLIINGWLPAVD